MEFGGGNTAEKISGALFRMHVAEAIFASTATVLFYDWLLILPQEVKYIWRASWKWTKVLYLLTRYLPFASMALMLRNQFALDATPESCQKTLQAVCWLMIIGMDVAEIVLAVRTYAVWNRDKRVGIGLVLLLGLPQIPSVIIAERFVQVITYVRNPHPEIVRGCVATSATRLIFVNWVIFIVMEGVLLGLMIISALKTCRGHTSNFLNVVYMDGIRFYLYIFCVTLANILITLFLPIEFLSVGASIEMVLHSTLACRLIVGLREASQSPGPKSETFELSGLPDNASAEFAHGPALDESVLVDLEVRAGPSEA